MGLNVTLGFFGAVGLSPTSPPAVVPTMTSLSPLEILYTSGVPRDAFMLLPPLPLRGPVKLKAVPRNSSDHSLPQPVAWQRLRHTPHQRQRCCFAGCRRFLGEKLALRLWRMRSGPKSAQWPWRRAPSQFSANRLSHGNAKRCLYPWRRWQGVSCGRKLSSTDKASLASTGLTSV